MNDENEGNRARALAIALLLSVALGTSLSEAVDLPDPPQGFDWRETPAIGAAFLVPDGWAFREEENEGTLAFFITAEEFRPPAKFTTGVTINVFLDNPSAAEQLEEIIRGTADRHGVTLTPGSFGPFNTLQCEIDLAATDNHGAIRVFYLTVANSRTGAGYFLIFESPVSRWEQMWPKGKVVLETLAIDADR